MGKRWEQACCVGSAEAKQFCRLDRLPTGDRRGIRCELFTKLQKAGIVVARKGIGGGFALALPATDVTAVEVVEAVDGRKALFECKGIRAQCARFGDRTPAWAVDGVCSIHALMLEAEQRARDAMAAHTLASIKGRVSTKTPKDHTGRVQEWLAARTPRRGRRRS
ncbi:transcriptional regulator [Phyllobacterium brassicacearum]|uniref:Transcriptional regulator n=1 Tax=Phyllobacterium brassicacearum TaxID=314235 RepID=A0A2P7BVF3_9HYPH|nr:transcriptional regulator [Phyllobacterium brassicacearum]